MHLNGSICICNDIKIQFKIMTSKSYWLLMVSAAVAAAINIAIIIPEL